MTERPLPPDGELIEAIRSGEPHIVELLVATYWEPLIQYAEGVLAGVADSQDIVQEAFVRLWEHRERWSSDGSVRALLYTVTRNAALDERRRFGRHQRVSRASDRPAPPATPAEDIASAELRRAAAAAVAALPQRRQEVFRLSREEGLTHTEIAAVLDLSAQTVANHMSLALSDLRSALAPWTEDEAGAP